MNWCCGADRFGMVQASKLSLLVVLAIAMSEETEAAN